MLLFYGCMFKYSRCCCFSSLLFYNMFFFQLTLAPKAENVVVVVVGECFQVCCSFIFSYAHFSLRIPPRLLRSSMLTNFLRRECRLLLQSAVAVAVAVVVVVANGAVGVAVVFGLSLVMNLASAKLVVAPCCCCCCCRSLVTCYVKSVFPALLLFSFFSCFFAHFFFDYLYAVFSFSLPQNLCRTSCPAAVDATCPDRRVFFPLLLLCCNSQFLMLLNFKHKHNRKTEKKVAARGGKLWFRGKLVITGSHKAKIETMQRDDFLYFHPLLAF